MTALDVGQIGDDVASRDRYDAVLHVFGMDELDLVDQVEFAQQHAADEPVEIAACHETKFLVRHHGFLLQRMHVCPRPC